jgi:hypothetical protein
MSEQIPQKNTLSVILQYYKLCRKNQDFYSCDCEYSIQWSMRKKCPGSYCLIRCNFLHIWTMNNKKIHFYPKNFKLHKSLSAVYAIAWLSFDVIKSNPDLLILQYFQLKSNPGHFRMSYLNGLDKSVPPKLVGKGWCK